MEKKLTSMPLSQHSDGAQLQLYVAVGLAPKTFLKTHGYPIAAQPAWMPGLWGSPLYL